MLSHGNFIFPDMLRDKLEKQKTTSAIGVNYVKSDRQKKTLENANISSANESKDLSENINMSAKTPVKSGFHTWISNRQLQNESRQTDTSPQYNPSNYHDCDGDDEMDILSVKLPLNCTATSNAGYRDVDSDLHYHCSSSSPQNQPLSPKKFDALADEIISRVKQELHLEKREASAGDEELATMNSTLVKIQSKDETFSPCSYMCDISSHNCPVCHELMVSSLCL